MKTTALLALPPLLLLSGGACRVDEGADSGRAEAATEVATLAGGCFWCMEKPFEVLPGVAEVVSGYTGGHQQDPTYEEVCGGGTGHAEAVQVHFDPRRIRYEEVLKVFWRQIDPTDPGGQFVDRGNQYRSEIFVHDEGQREVAERSKAALAASGRFDEPIVTEITDFERFWEAEEYHQDFYEKSPERYHGYRRGSGRDRFLDSVWGDERTVDIPDRVAEGGPSGPWTSFEKPSEEELSERLTPLQFDVTQRDGTERPFSNEFWDDHRAGIYVDVVSGEPLFSSTDKFESGTGWPSFTRPLVEANVTSDVDHKLGYPRDEVRSRYADSHLGHVFEDGPAPTGLRYCINSAALRFVPAERLEDEGYGAFAALFEPAE